MTLIIQAFESPMSSMFHFTPFKLFQKLPNSEHSKHVYSDIYNSDVFLDKHDKVQRVLTDDPTCKCEKLVAALMFWLDATHLATFTRAKMWPIYMVFSNLSKYIRCQPNSGATMHLVYIPLLPDSLQDKLSHFTINGEHNKRMFLCTVGRNSCIQYGRSCSMTTLFMPPHMEWLCAAMMELSDRCIHTSLPIWQITLRRSYLVMFLYILAHHPLYALGFYSLLFMIRDFVPVHAVSPQKPS